MTPVLETPRLWLRPLDVADAAQAQVLSRRWEIVRYLAAIVPWPYPPDGALAFYHAVERGYPKTITVDNGTEFYSKAMDSWAYRHGVQLQFIRNRPVMGVWRG